MKLSGPAVKDVVSAVPPEDDPALLVVVIGHTVSAIDVGLPHAGPAADAVSLESWVPGIIPE